MPVVLTAPMTRPSLARSRRMNAAQAVSGSRRVTFVTPPDLGASTARASVAISVPLDLGGKAAANGVVGVDRLDFRVREQSADAGIGLTGLGEDRVRHHAVAIESAERQDTLFEYGRDLIHIFGRILIRLGYEDRV